jgi:hypothetical protein
LFLSSAGNELAGNLNRREALQDICLLLSSAGNELAGSSNRLEYLPITFKLKKSVIQ